MNCDLLLSKKHSSWTHSGCNGRLGNQLGLLTLQLGIHYKYGSDIVLLEYQYKELKDTFSIEECLSDHLDSFCTIFNGSKDSF